MINQHKQKGTVLFVAIIFLLLLTIIGVSTVKTSLNQTQVAGNSMFSVLVYQGAESTLARTASDKDLTNLAQALAIKPNTYQVPANYIPPETITKGGKLVSSSGVTFQGIFDCPTSSGLATSTIMKCQIYRIEASSQIVATNARDKHIKGTAIISP